mmetsp:Transcript_34963/g.60163  ORF Transcript_34963/g.60163 Transcript_34963/m.60163 type:complete len:208 (-) Transcript_34963:370-993(-)
MTWPLLWRPLAALPPPRVALSVGMSQRPRARPTGTPTTRWRLTMPSAPSASSLSATLSQSPSSATANRNACATTFFISSAPGRQRSLARIAPSAVPSLRTCCRYLMFRTMLSLVMMRMRGKRRRHRQWGSCGRPPTSAPSLMPPHATLACSGVVPSVRQRWRRFTESSRSARNHQGSVPGRLRETRERLAEAVAAVGPEHGWPNTKG